MESIKATLEEISELENIVRGHINTHRYQAELLKKSRTWNQICSSLDAIGDVVFAISSYIESEFPEDDGLKYIYIYGILQSIIIQQDAMKHLSESLGLKYKISEPLKMIRKIRNASIGHPTEHKDNGRRYYNSISRCTMQKYGFDLLMFSESKPFNIKRIDLLEIVEVQLEGIKNSYMKLSGKLTEIDKMHKKHFKRKRLLDVFHSVLGYYFDKISEGIHTSSHGNREFGLVHIKKLRETYRNFEEGLRDRNELRKDIECDLKEYKHAINQLEKYLSGKNDGMIELDAYIYYYYLREKNEEYVQIAKEIDASLE